MIYVSRFHLSATFLSLFLSLIASVPLFQAEASVQDQPCRLPAQFCALQGFVIQTSEAERLVRWRDNTGFYLVQPHRAPRFLDRAGGSQVFALALGSKDLYSGEHDHLIKTIVERGGAVYVTRPTLEDAAKLQELSGLAGGKWVDEDLAPILYGVRLPAEDRSANREVSFLMVLAREPKQQACYYCLNDQEIARLLEIIGSRSRPSGSEDLVLAENPETPPIDADPVDANSDHFHQAYFIQPHNSYDRGKKITDWLDRGLRSLELDVLDKDDWEDKDNGPYVGHSTFDTGNTNCSGDRLGNCLKDVIAWLDTHPGEGPLLTFVDMKLGAFDWPSEHVKALDDKVFDIAGPYLYTGDDLFDYAIKHGSPSNTTMRKAVSLAGWPLLKDLTGKIIIGYTGGGTINHNKRMAEATELIDADDRRPYGFYCPDVESDAEEVEVDGTVDGMSKTTSQTMVCSNLQAQDHYQATANAASDANQIIHLWGNHVYNNDSWVYNYIAIAQGISAVGRDAKEADSFDDTLPLVGVRRSVPGYFQVRPVNNSNLCLDSSSGSGKRENVYFHSCHSDGNQRFVYTAESQLRPQSDNKYCVDIDGGDAEDNANIHLFDCGGDSSEKWELTPEGTFESHDNTAFCIGFDEDPDKNAEVEPCTDYEKVFFSLYPVAEW